MRGNNRADGVAGLGKSLIIRPGGVQNVLWLGLWAVQSKQTTGFPSGVSSYNRPRRPGRP